MNGFFSGCFCLFIVSNLKLSGKYNFFGKITNNIYQIIDFLSYPKFGWDYFFVLTSKFKIYNIVIVLGSKSPKNNYLN